MSDSKTPPGLSDQESTEKPSTDLSNESAERQLLKRLWGLSAPVSPSNLLTSEVQEEMLLTPEEEQEKREFEADMRARYPAITQEALDYTWTTAEILT